MQSAGVAYDLRAVATTKKVGFAFSGKTGQQIAPMWKIHLYTVVVAQVRDTYFVPELRAGAENFKNKSKTSLCIKYLSTDNPGTIINLDELLLIISVPTTGTTYSKNRKKHIL